MKCTPELAATIAIGVMRAAEAIVINRRISIDEQQLLAALKETIRAEYPALLDELGEAHQSHMGEPILHSIFNVGCTHIAVKALKQYGLQARGLTFIAADAEEAQC